MELNYRQVHLKCRPRRPVILIDGDQGWDEVFRAIYAASEVWGGWYSAIAPKQPAAFEALLPLLSRFDPDDVISRWKPEDLSPETVQLMERYLSPIRKPGSVWPVSWTPDWRLPPGDYLYIPENASHLGIDKLDNPVVHCRYDAITAWAYSQTGHVSCERIDPGSLDASGEPIPITKSAINLKDDQPYSASFRMLHHAGPLNSTSSRFPFVSGNALLAVWGPMTQKRPNACIVVGARVADFCLYHVLSRMRENVFWLPYDDRETDPRGRTRLTHAYTRAVLRRLAETAPRKTEVHVTTVSGFGGRVQYAELEDIHQRWCSLEEHLPSLCADQVTIRTVMPTDVSALLPHRRFLAEECVGQTAWIPFDESLAQTSVPTPEVGFRDAREDQSWIVDTSWSDWTSVQCARLPVEENASEWQEPLRSGRNCISYRADRITYAGGGPPAPLREPVCRLPGRGELGRHLLEQRGISPKGSSDKGRYENDFIRVSGGLEQASAFLRDEVFRAILSDYWIDKDHASRFYEDRFELSYASMDSVLKCVTEVTGESYTWDDLRPRLKRLLELGILEQGYILRCDRCSHSDWYDIEDITQTFQCDRCRHEHHLEPSPTAYWRLYEPIRLAGINNSQPSILALDALRQLDRTAFVFETAISIDSDGGELPGDIDFMAFSGPHAFLGEAKSTARLASCERGRLNQLILRVRPDFLVLATDQRQWSQGQIKTHILPLQKQILRVGTRIITMDEADLCGQRSMRHRMMQRDFIVETSEGR